jgi:hypothetical protein
MPYDSLARVFAIVTASTASIHDDGCTWACDVLRQRLLHLWGSLCLSADSGSPWRIGRARRMKASVKSARTSSPRPGETRRPRTDGSSEPQRGVPRN